MALQDIFDAITNEASARISDAQSERRTRMKALREDSDRRLALRKKQIADQKTRSMLQIKERAESHARMVRNRTILAKKRECLEKLYEDVLEKLRSLPKDKSESFLKICLSEIHEKGTIHPAEAHRSLLTSLLPDGCTIGTSVAASGGFRFSSRTKEYDFTYEFIVHRLLLPLSEVAVAAALFATAA